MKRSASVVRTWLGIGAFVLAIIAGPQSGISRADEREISLPEQYQTNAEKERLENQLAGSRFGLSVGFGSGIYSDAQRALANTLFPISDPGRDAIFERLGLRSSDNIFTVSPTGTYRITERAGLYLTVPSGLVSRDHEPVARFDPQYGIGDVHGGASYNLLTESGWIPAAIVSLDVKSNTATYGSLGNGVWGFTPGVQPIKSITESIFVFGLFDYAYNLERSGVKVGDVIGYGGGLRVLLRDRETAGVIGLKMSSVADSKIEGQTVVAKHDDLMLFLGSESLYSGYSIQFYLTGLNEGLGLKKNTAGFEISIPIF